MPVLMEILPMAHMVDLI